jgi:hypothetical protein
VKKGGRNIEYYEIVVIINVVLFANSLALYSLNYHVSLKSSPNIFWYICHKEAIFIHLLS